MVQTDGQHWGLSLGLILTLPLTDGQRQECQKVPLPCRGWSGGSGDTRRVGADRQTEHRQAESNDHSIADC